MGEPGAGVWPLLLMVRRLEYVYIYILPLRLIGPSNPFRFSKLTEKCRLLIFTTSGIGLQAI